LAGALVSAALHPLAPAVSQVINQANARLATGCVAVARAFAAIPGGHWRVDGAGGERLVVYDLPYGAGAAVWSDGRGAAVMIDCADARGFRNQMLPALRRQGVRPDSVILSHPDGSHLGGGAPVWRSLPVRQALLPVADARSPAYRAWLREAPAEGVAVGVGVAGARHRLAGGAWIEVVHDPSMVSANAAADERVMLVRLHWGGWRLLFTSDAGLATERRVLEAGRDVAADVIIAGKHRDDLNLGDDFLHAVRPRVIIASNTAHPPEERLDREQAAHWRSQGIEVFDPLESGAVIVTLDADGSLRVSGFMDGRTIVLRRSPEPPEG